MSEQLQILFMQTRLVRLASNEWNIPISEVNGIFINKDVYHYIKKLWGLFHVEGDYAVLKDIEKYVGREAQDD